MPTASDPRTDPMAFPAEVGQVWLNRIVLEQRLSESGNPERWRVVDRRTRTVHLLEPLPSDRITRLSDAEREALIEPFIHPSIPGLLAHCRIEGAWPHYASLSAFDPRVIEPPLASVQAKIPADPVAAMRCFFALGTIVARLHEGGLRAHAAITPECVWLSASGEVLLGGYPFSHWAVGESASPFISPQRREGAKPDPSDDLYSLGALAAFLLTGGNPPPLKPTKIDELRQQRGLPPTGWPKGWDEPLLAAMGALPSLRPASVGALLERLGQSTTVVVPAMSRPPAAEPVRMRARKPPSWRLAKRPDLLHRIHEDGPRVEPSTSNGEALGAWSELRRQQSEVEAQRVDLERRARLLAEDIARAGERKAEIARLDAELERGQDEYNRARIALDAELAAHEAAKTKLRAELDALAADRKRFDAGEAKARADWEARKKEVDARQASTESRQSELKRLEAELKQKSDEQERREQTLAESAARLQKERLAWIEEQAEAERARQEKSAAPEGSAAPAETSSTKDASTSPAVGEETRLVLAKLEAVESQRDRLESELTALRESRSLQATQQATLDELNERLRQRDEELAKRSAQLAELKENQNRQQDHLAAARAELEANQAELEKARERFAQEQAAWQEESRRKTAELEATVERARKKAPKISSSRPASAGESSTGAEPLAKPSNGLVLGVAAGGALIALVLGFMLFRSSGEVTRLREAAAQQSSPTALVVVTDPLGAEVTVSGQPPKTSPARFDGLQPGSVQVRVTKEGYRPQERTFDLREGQTLVSDALILNPMAPAQGPSGWLYVRTRPMGAQVTRIGSAPVTAPALLPGLPPGPTRLTIRLEGYLPVERTVEIKPGEDTVLDLTLQPAPPPRLTGEVRITTEPAGAEVRVEGLTPQQSPARFGEVPPGTVRITVTKEGFEPFEQQVAVRGGEVIQVPTVVLRPKPAPTPAPRVATPLVLPKELTLAAGSREFKLQRVEPGEVNWGDTERGRARARVTRPFLMSETEVTQAAYLAIMGDNPSAIRERKVQGPSRTIMEDFTTTVMSGGRPTSVTQKRPKVVPGEEVVTPLNDHPVENVTWEQAMEFCLRLTRASVTQGKLPAGTVIRLPTEAEWELAQRRGADWGGADARAALERFAWFSEVAEGGHRATQGKRANANGLYDLDGNVAEWCLDAWSTAIPAEATNDPVTLDAGQQTLLGVTPNGAFSVSVVSDAFNRRVVRGGSWRTPASALLAQPVRASQPARADDIGFRVVVGMPVGAAPAR